MRIVEILLPKTLNNRDLSPQVARKIDMLQNRMDKYVDKIFDPSTSAAGKEFLKSKLRDDYYELKNTIGHLHAVAEGNQLAPQEGPWEVYDRKTGLRVAGPIASKSRARLSRDKKDNEYGGYRYGVRLYGSTGVGLSEAVHKCPLSDEDFDLIKELMERPIPAAIAPIYLHEVIDDDELNDQFKSLEETEPSRDVRPLVAEWLNRVMPDQMKRFIGDSSDGKQNRGILSPIHGYDPHMYKGANEPITGNAYGKR